MGRIGIRARWDWAFAATTGWGTSRDQFGAAGVGGVLAVAGLWLFGSDVSAAWDEALVFAAAAVGAYFLWPFLKFVDNFLRAPTHIREQEIIRRGDEIARLTADRDGHIALIERLQAAPSIKVETVKPATLGYEGQLKTCAPSHEHGRDAGCV